MTNLLVPMCQLFGDSSVLTTKHIDYNYNFTSVVLPIYIYIVVIVIPELLY